MGERRTFGEDVRQRRLEAGLSQAELAERAGISERAVSDIERGLRASVYAATARRLADALAVADDRRGFLLAAAGRPAASHAAPPPFAESPRYRARLPLPLTRLVGRDTDLAAVGALLGDSGTRIVTLVGTGGAGKTRLAVEAAVRWQSASGDAVHFVDLGSVADSAAVLAAIATSIGLAVDGGDVLARLSDALAGRRVLLVLDTMEHVLEAAPAVADLVAMTPALTALVTSRSPLRVRGEHQRPIGPLALDVPPGGGTTAPAVELFLERAREASPRVAQTADIIELASAICARLDGVPLAIELAAARTSVMTLPALLSSLDDRLAPLVEGRRDSPSRHQTMRAALDWSYAMLGEPERRTLRALSVFRGGANADAAVAVAGGSATGASITALAEASLVVVDPGTAQQRVRWLDLVAAYGADLAQELGERDALQRTHMEHFLHLAQHAAPHLRGSGQRTWFARLLDDEANLRAAMTRALDVRDSTTALELGAALWMFWRWAGLFADARMWLDSALALEAPRSELRLPVLWGAGWLALHQGDDNRMAEAGVEMLELARSDAVQRRNALTLVGTAQMARGADDAAIVTLTEALSLAESASDVWARATSLLNLGTALSAAGRAETAVSLCRQALVLYESIGDRHFAARAQLQLAYALMRLSDAEGAASCISDALALARDLGDMWSAAEGLEAVSALRAADRPADAILLAAAAERIRDVIGMQAHPPDARLNSARLQLARSALGEKGSAEAWQRGHAASLETAMELADEFAGPGA